MTIKLDKLLPVSLSLSDTFLFLCIFSLAVLCLCGLVRLILGRESSLKHAIVSSLGIIVLYCVCVLIFTFNPAGLSSFLVPLPYATFAGGQLALFNFSTSDFPLICQQLLSMLLLTFLVNQVNSFVPKGKNIFTWLAFRAGCIMAAIFVHYLTYRILNALTSNMANSLMLNYAPVILLSILVFMFLLGFVKFLIGLFLTVANPLLGAVYAFFFANKIGKNISRAIGSTITLTIFTIILHHLGYHYLPIDVGALPQYLPFCIWILILWVIIGHLL